MRSTSCRAPAAAASRAAASLSSGSARHVEGGGEGLHAGVAEARHHAQHAGAVDAAGQEHPVRHLGALVQRHAFLQRAVEPGQRFRLADLLGRALRQGGDAGAVDHPAVGDPERLAGQQAADAGKDGVAAGGELQLQQLVARFRPQRPLHQPGGEQRLRLRREGQAVLQLGDIERLDAERVARQRQVVGAALVDGDRVHAAERLDIALAVAQPQMQRRLAVAAGGEPHLGQCPAQLQVVVDLAVGDQRRRAREQRLVAAIQVDDGEAGVHQRHPADHGVASTVRPAMRERPHQRGQAGGIQPVGGGAGPGRGVSEREAGNPAHQHASTVCRNCRQRASTGPAANSRS